MNTSLRRRLRGRRSAVAVSPLWEAWSIGLVLDKTCFRTAGLVSTELSPRGGDRTTRTLGRVRQGRRGGPVEVGVSNRWPRRSLSESHQTALPDTLLWGACEVPWARRDWCEWRSICSAIFGAIPESVSWALDWGLRFQTLWRAGRTWLSTFLTVTDFSSCPATVARMT